MIIFTYEYTKGDLSGQIMTAGVNTDFSPSNYFSIMFNKTSTGNYTIGWVLAGEAETNNNTNGVHYYITITIRYTKNI